MGTTMPVLPKELYAVFCGGIEQATVQKIVNGLTAAMAAKVEHVHALFQTAGGYVGDGVFLYNFFRTIPIELTLYNGGQISSIGVVAFLGAKRRKATADATFLLHRSTNSTQFATAASLQQTARSLILDDERTERIIREHVQFPPECWESLERHDLYFSGDEAMKYGIATEIGSFAPPPGVEVYNLLG